MPKLYQSGATHSGLVGNRASAADFGSGLGEGLEQVSASLQAREDSAAASALVDFQLNASRNLKDLSQRVAYDATEDAYKLDGQSLDDNEDLYTLSTKHFEDAQKEFTSRWGNRYEGKLNAIRQSYSLQAINENAKALSSGQLNKFDQNSNEMFASVERGENTEAEALAVLSEQLAAVNASPDARNQAWDATVTNLSVAGFNYLFSQSPVNAYNAIQEGEYDDVDPSIREGFYSHIESYASAETKSQISKQQEANKYLVDYQIDPELIALHDSMGNEAAATELTRMNNLHQEGMDILEMSYSAVARDLKARYEKAELANDIQGMEEAKYLMSFNERKYQMMMNDPKRLSRILGAELIPFDEFPQDAIEARRQYRFKLARDNDVPVMDIPLIGAEDAQQIVSNIDNLSVDDKVLHVVELASMFNEDEIGAVGAELKSVSNNTAFALMEGKSVNPNKEVIKGLLIGNTLDIPKPKRSDFIEGVYKEIGAAAVDNLGMPVDDLVEAVSAVYNYQSGKSGDAKDKLRQPKLRDALKLVTGNFINNGNNNGIKAPGFKLDSGEYVESSVVPRALKYYANPENRAEFEALHYGKVPQMQNEPVDLNYALSSGTLVPTRTEGIYHIKTVANKYYRDEEGNHFEFRVKDMVQSHLTKPPAYEGFFEVIMGIQETLTSDEFKSDFMSGQLGQGDE